MNTRRTDGIILLVSIAFSLAALSPRQSFAQTQTDKGIELYNSWDYPEAEKIFREVLNSGSPDIHASYFLGMSLLQQSKFNEALEVFQKVKEAAGKTERRAGSSAPDESLIYVALARAHLGLKQHADAWRDLESAMKINARSPEVYVYRGAYYIQQEKPQEAVKALEKAIQMDKQNVYAHYYAGYAYLRSGNPAWAVDMFKTFLQLAPRAPEAVKVKALIDALC